MCSGHSYFNMVMVFSRKPCISRRRKCTAPPFIFPRQPMKRKERMSLKNEAGCRMRAMADSGVNFAIVSRGSWCTPAFMSYPVFTTAQLRYIFSQLSRCSRCSPGSHVSWFEVGRKQSEEGRIGRLSLQRSYRKKL